jgi:hypothetical protein
MTPAARTFIKSKASEIEEVLLPARLMGLPPEEFVVLVLDTGARVGTHPRPLVFLVQRAALAALRHAGASEARFDCDAPGVREIFGGTQDGGFGARATKILLDEASHLLDETVPPGRVLTIAKFGDELAAMVFRPAGEAPSPIRHVN